MKINAKKEVNWAIFLNDKILANQRDSGLNDAIRPLLSYLNASGLCIHRRPICCSLFSLSFLCDQRILGRETISNRDGASLPRVSTVRNACYLVRTCVLRAVELPRVRAYITVVDRRRRKRRDATLIRNIYAGRSRAHQHVLSRRMHLRSLQAYLRARERHDSLCNSVKINEMKK